MGGWLKEEHNLLKKVLQKFFMEGCEVMMFTRKTRLLGTVKIILLVALLLTLIVSQAGAVEKTIKIWGIGAEGEKLPELIEQFEKANPDIKVKLEALSWGVAHDKMVTSIAAGTAPDVMQMGSTWITEFAEMGAIANLDKYVKGWDGLRDMLTASMEINKYQGSYYGVPWYVDVRATFWRKDLFKAAGYDRPPATWDELVEMRQKLHTDDMHWALATPPGGNDAYLTWIGYLWSNGGELLTPDNKKAAFNSPEGVEALQFYSDLFNKYKIAPAVVAGGVDAEEGFKTGYYAMFAAGPWMIGSLTQALGKEKVGLMLAPKKKYSSSFLGGCELVILEQSKNKDAAWKFIEYCASTEGEIKLFKLLGNIPGRLSVQEEIKGVSEIADIFIEQSKYSKSTPAIPQTEKIGTIIDEAIENVCIGGADPKEELDRAATKVNELLK